MAAVQRLTRQAWAVFRVCLGERSVNHESLKCLQEAMTNIHASDLKIEAEGRYNFRNLRSFPSASSAEPESPLVAGGDASRRAPVGYMHIFEDSVLTMGVFILREGSCIPLHNHPGMHGLVKVLYGNLRIKSFSPIADELSHPSVPQFEGFPENKQPNKQLLLPTCPGVDQLFNASSETVLLSPTDGNYHSLESVGGPAAFLDILSPPYDPVDGRDCYYFRELKEKSAQQNKGAVEPGAGVHRTDIQWLLTVSQPYDFWCDEVDYRGPQVTIDSS